MARAKGRSNDITILPKKPIPKGFKVWICAYHGYTWAFELYSREHSAERSSQPRPVIPMDLYLQAHRATNGNKSLPKTSSEGSGLLKHRPYVIGSPKTCRGSTPGYCISTTCSSTNHCLRCYEKTSGWAPWAQHARMREGSPAFYWIKRRRSFYGGPPT
jgi:hypothetical protein